MSIAYRVQDYLAERRLNWDPVPHPWSATTLEAAHRAHVPAERVAKAVVLQSGSRFIVAVVPADRHLDLRELGKALGETVTLVDERSLGGIFGDCEPGAVPAVGTAYGVQTLWDADLGECRDVFFEGGDHRTLVHMFGPDFIELMRQARPLPVAPH